MNYESLDHYLTIYVLDCAQNINHLDSQWDSNPLKKNSYLSLYREISTNIVLFYDTVSISVITGDKLSEFWLKGLGIDARQCRVLLDFVVVFVVVVGFQLVESDRQMHPLAWPYIISNWWRQWQESNAVSAGLKKCSKVRLLTRLWKKKKKKTALTLYTS